MGVWISLLLWIVLAVLLLGGWFYNMGQYRNVTKAVLSVGGTCVAAMWLLARFSPSVWLVGAVAALAVLAVVVVLAVPALRHTPIYGVVAAAIVAALGTVYVLDKAMTLPSYIPYAGGGVLFVLLYVIITFVYGRRRQDEE